MTETVNRGRSAKTPRGDWQGARAAAAVRHGPITLIAPLVAIYPLVTVILSAVMLKHVAITRRIVAGTVLTVTGVALVLAG